MSPAEEIRRATLESVKNRNQLINSSNAQTLAIYENVTAEIQKKISAAGVSGRVELNHLQALLSDVNGQLRKLEQLRDGLLYRQIDEAVLLGASPFKTSTFAINHQAAAFVREFVGADGLQLSDRLWRVNQLTSQRLGDHIQYAVITGESSHQAALRALANQEEVSQFDTEAIKRASVSHLNSSIKELMTGEGSAYKQTERLFRTELARAHGEAYMSNAFNVDGVVGVRFCLSPNHPKEDICDVHASADLYNLGPGVYPDRASCPWPAHPNTLSYVMAEFDDVVNEDEKPLSQDYQKITDLDELISRGHAIGNDLLEDKTFDFTQRLHEKLNETRPTGKAIRFEGRGQGVKFVQAASQMFPDSWTSLSDKAGSHFARYAQARGFQWTAYRDMDTTKLGGFGTLRNVKKGSAYFLVDNFGTAVHEFTHRLQATVPGLDDLFQTIHIRRTGGAPYKSLNLLTNSWTYGHHEIAQEDHYIHPYQGKVYNIMNGYSGKVGALEVMTMAFESVLSGSNHHALEFAEKDRELFDLVIGSLFHYDP